MEELIISNYTTILKEELVLALGCTEPISIAYCAAMSREVLNQEPERIEIIISGNMLKNAMGVIIPNTSDLKGALAAAILGVMAGNASKKLEVLEDVTEEDIKETKDLMKTDFAQLKTLCTPIKLYIQVTAYKGDSYATVEIKHTHTNIVKIEKDHQIQFFSSCSDEDFNTPLVTREYLKVVDIYQFVNTVPLDELAPLIKSQINLNYEIASYGLTRHCGLSVGATLLQNAEGIIGKAKAYTASGSDARMSGCSMPVMTICGSGNQGITSSVPLVVIAKEKNIDEERLIRAVMLSDLITIHIKTNIGRLSAFCGVVVAGTGAACGITYLQGGGLKQIENTIKNILANISGIFCDGAKPSCAAKIASSIDAAFQAALLSMSNHTVESCSGIISDDIEETIQNIGEIVYQAMNETDQKIIEIMSRKTKKVSYDTF